MNPTIDVRHDPDAATWTILAGDHALVFRMERGQLQCEHYGLAAGADRSFDGPPPDWPDHGQQIFRGRRDASVTLRGEVAPVAWAFDGCTVTGGEERDVVEIALRGTEVPLRAEVTVAIDHTGSTIDRTTTLRHTGEPGSEPLDIASASSFSCTIPDVEQLVTTYGWWVSETQVSRASARTPVLLESRSGKTGFEHAPYLALEGVDRTTVVQLGWSGNWMIHAAPLWDGRVHVSGGLNSFGLRHRLRPGDSLELPSMVAVTVDGDLNAATQTLHALHRSRRIAPRRRIPVHYNTWYPHPGEAHVDQLVALMPGAATLGCESFVLDAGWYTTATPPQGDHWLKWAGDWVTNGRLYPNGLPELADAARAHGMEFGLWLEPEAAGPESDLVRNHPEWMHTVPDFPWGPIDLRVVHLGIDEAFDTVLQSCVAQLRATGATWMKWDFNANIWEGGWHPDLGPQDHDPLIAHYAGVYRFQAALLEAIPDLVLEMCSSGGGRYDIEIMRRAHTAWASDQWAPLENLSIHFGSHLLHPPEEVTDWLIEWPPRKPESEANARTDLRFRTNVGMLGSFGVSAPLTAWTADELDLVAREIALYLDHVRDLLPVSNQYILTEQPPLHGGGDWAAMWFVAPDSSRGSLSTFRLEGGPECTFGLAGLEASAVYRVLTADGELGTRTGAELTSGLTVRLDEQYRSQMFAVVRIDA